MPRPPLSPVCLCWLFLSAVLYSSLGGSVISFISPEQVKDIGEDVRFECAVDNADDFSVVWSKVQPDQPSKDVVLAIKDSLTLKDPRYSLSENQNGSTTTYSLKISNLEATDMGTYECQVIVSVSEKVTKSVNLLVKHPPIISEKLTQKSIKVVEGQSGEIVCAAEGYPRPRISWKREYNAIMPGGGHIHQDSTLKFRPAHRLDRGVYYCVADNSVGNPDQKAVSVEVEFSPTISTPRPKIAQAKFYGVELECKIEAYPAPAITWYKDGVQLVSNGNYRITNIATAFEVTDSVVRILSVDDKDYGDYYCNATNKMGQAEARINLFRAHNPDINFPGLIWTSGSPRPIFSHLHLIELIAISSLTAILRSM